MWNHWTVFLTTCLHAQVHVHLCVHVHPCAISLDKRKSDPHIKNLLYITTKGQKSHEVPLSCHYIWMCLPCDRLATFTGYNPPLTNVCWDTRLQPPPFSEQTVWKIDGWMYDSCFLIQTIKSQVWNCNYFVCGDRILCLHHKCLIIIYIRAVLISLLQTLDDVY